MLGKSIMDAQLNGVADVRVEGRDRARLRCLYYRRHFAEERILGQHVGVCVDALERLHRPQRAGQESVLQQNGVCVDALERG